MASGTITLTDARQVADLVEKFKTVRRTVAWKQLTHTLQAILIQAGADSNDTVNGLVPCRFNPSAGTVAYDTTDVIDNDQFVFSP